MYRVEISPRLMPGIKIGETWISIEPTTKTDNRGAPYWEYHFDGPDFEHSGDDLAGWTNAAGMLETLLSFLSASVESYRYEERTGREAENTDLFPPDVVEWAVDYSDEIDIARFELEEK